MSKENTYYLWGPDSYLLQQKINEIIIEVEQKTGEKPEIMVIDSDEIGPGELRQTLDFSPLFGLNRVVIIRNPFWLGKSTRKGKQAGNYLQVLQDYFQQEPEGQVLVITSTEFNSNQPINSFLEKEASIFAIKKLSSSNLSQWIKEQMESRGLLASPSAINIMANSGQDMYYLENLINKLALIYRNGPVEVNDLQEHLDSNQDLKVFKLTDALLNRNLNAALSAYYQLRDQGEHHLFLLFMISRQLLSLGKVKYYQELGYSAQEITELIGQKAFTVKKLMKMAGKFRGTEIRGLFKKLLELDMSYKGDSKDPGLLMEMLIVDFCGEK